MSRNLKIQVYVAIFIQGQILYLGTLGSLAWVLLFSFWFLERGKKNILRLTRTQLVEEGIALGDKGGEVFDSLELHHIVAGIWAC